MLDGERIHEANVVVDQCIERPRKIARHRRGFSEAAHVRPDDTVKAGEMRHPSIPDGAAFSVAVEHEYRFRLAPRIGVVVDPVMHLHVRGNLQRRHRCTPVALALFTHDAEKHADYSRTVDPPAATDETLGIHPNGIEPVEGVWQPCPEP